VSGAVQGNADYRID